MGRGNWFPGPTLADCRVVYVDYSDSAEDIDDSDLAEFRWLDLRDAIEACLPKSFTVVSTYADLPYRLRQPWRDCSPVAYNGLFTLWCDSQGDDYHLGLGFTLNEAAPGLAASKLGTVADKFFDKLDERYDLSVRACAWTSSPYKPLVAV